MSASKDYHLEKEEEGKGFDYHLFKRLWAYVTPYRKLFYLSLLMLVLGTLFQLHVDVSRQPQPHSLGFDQGDVAVDDARLLQRAHPAQAGRLAKVNLLGQFAVAETAVPLQGSENLVVDPVELHFRSIC